ncbi:MAG TPA: hypothetical protein VHG93_10485 [Longimicrobium sp.]|nr:hypothetical protein [Longimicrobium sp.]
MKKMKLNLEQLAVDSFDTSAAAEKRGTVFGEQCTCHTQCTCPGCPTCQNYATCDQSCNGTCDASCVYGTCAGQYTCEGTCDSCYFTQCVNTCYNCPTVSGGPCECWI